MAVQFVRLRKVSDRKRIVVNLAHLVSVEELDESTEVTLTDGRTFDVEETERAVRGLIAKSGGSDESAE